MADYKINKKLKFMNPYNFVSTFDSMEKKTSERKNDNQGELLSGVLKCRMITRTPLAILETESVETKEKGHPIYDFYKIEDIPAIPGSSIRGVLRSCYETLTDSCFVTMSSSEKELITERVPATSPFKPGVLIKEGDEWHLYSATRGKLKIGDEYKVEADSIKGRYIKAGKQIFENGEYVEAEFETYESTNKFNKKVSVTKAKYIKKCDGNKSKFVLFIGETINKKNSESVFKIDKKVEKTDTAIKNALAGLENSLLIYRDAKINKKYGDEHTGYRNHDYAKNNGVIPLWYKEENNILYFSIAAIGRRSFSTSINDLIGDMRTPCTCRDNMCQACKLFGMSKKEAYGSHIRISDAIGTKVILTESAIALKELGTPRPGYYLFYGKDGKPYDVIQAGIAGRKYYWHNPKASTDPSVYEESDSKKITERNASCVLAQNGSEFEFQVYYDKITSAQLKQLMWVIALGDNRKESEYCHKIGHGKPIGLGSVKLLIEENLVRNVGDDLEYSFDNMPINIESEPAEGLIKSVWDKQMRYMLDFNFVQDYIVSYPFVVANMKGYEGRIVKDNVLASHQWFSHNKTNAKNNPEVEVLHHITENVESMLLSAYSVVLNDKDFERNSNSVSFEQEKEYKAEVISLKEKYIGAKVQGKEIRIYFKESDIKLKYGQLDKVLAINDKIKVRYLGEKSSNDGKKYDTWHLIGKA